MHAFPHTQIWPRFSDHWKMEERGILETHTQHLKNRKHKWEIHSKYNY